MAANPSFGTAAMVAAGRKTLMRVGIQSTLASVDLAGRRRKVLVTAIRTRGVVAVGGMAPAAAAAAGAEM